MNKNRDLVFDEFRKLCEHIAELEASYSPELEAGYESLLCLIEGEPDSEELFSDAMISSIRTYRNVRNGGKPLLSIDAIAFCMHRLRWKAVLATAERENEEFFAARADNSLLRLIDSFTDNWREADDYRIYREQD
ncbi:hypothetical protein KPL74_05660 [Bacillus sp. NP157]|nr:hypothetical protein KPL74_05660 [Bacillus sp. NP157]